MSVLVAYASKHGATQEVAERVAKRISAHGLQVTNRRLSSITADEPAVVNRADAILIGSAIYAGAWMRDAVKFVDQMASYLVTKQVWAFSCGPVGNPLAPIDRPKGADITAQKAGAIEHKIFPGVVDRTGLSFVERQMMRALKVPDGDYRVWPEIDAWTDGVAGEIRSALARSGSL